MAVFTDTWRPRAIRAIDRFRSMDDGAQGVMAYALMAGACGWVYGWTHAWTTTYLDRVYALQNPDGGWGLNRPFDSFGDGTVNPPDTTYAVTVAGHIGPVLLDGFRAGAVPRERIQAIVNLLVAFPRVPVDVGQCVAYSTAPADKAAGRGVHNVNAGVGLFLHEAAVSGFSQSGTHRLIADITAHEAAAYRAADRWWPYAGDGPAQDTDHNSYSAEAMYRLSYWLGREAVYFHLTNALADNAQSPIAHMRLISLPGGPASMLGLNGTLWADLGRRWTAEIDAFIASPPSPAGQRLTQAAYYLGRAGRI